LKCSFECKIRFTFVSKSIKLTKLGVASGSWKNINENRTKQ
jgi:hypothetical protein